MRKEMAREEEASGRESSAESKARAAEGAKTGARQTDGPREGHRLTKPCAVKMRALVLCSGTGSLDRAFLRQNWEVVSVDWLAKFRPSICVDIMLWDYKAAFPKRHFDFVWSSPQCTMFSQARTTGGPRDIEGATALVAKCLEISRWFGCTWCLENPQTGRLKEQPIMQGLPYTDLTYCKYDDYPYRKATRLWHSAAFGSAFVPRPVCCKESPCAFFAASRCHPKSAQHGATRAKGGGRRADDDCSQDQLYSIPPSLCDAVVDAATILATQQRHAAQDSAAARDRPLQEEGQ